MSEVMSNSIMSIRCIVVLVSQNFTTEMNTCTKKLSMSTCAIIPMWKSHKLAKDQTARKQNRSGVKMFKGRIKLCLTEIFSIYVILCTVPFWVSSFIDNHHHEEWPACFDKNIDICCQCIDNVSQDVSNTIHSWINIMPLPYIWLHSASLIGVIKRALCRTCNYTVSNCTNTPRCTLLHHSCKMRS